MEQQIEYWRTGTIKSITHYNKEGKKHGEEIIFHFGGNIKSVTMYENGMKHGPYYRCDTYKDKSELGAYHKNRKNGFNIELKHDIGLFYSQYEYGKKETINYDLGYKKYHKTIENEESYLSDINGKMYVIFKGNTGTLYDDDFKPMYSDSRVMFLGKKIFRKTHDVLNRNIENFVTLDNKKHYIFRPDLQKHIRKKNINSMYFISKPRCKVNDVSENELPDVMSYTFTIYDVSISKDANGIFEMIVIKYEYVDVFQTEDGYIKDYLRSVGIDYGALDNVPDDVYVLNDEYDIKYHKCMVLVVENAIETLMNDLSQYGKIKLSKCESFRFVSTNDDAKSIFEEIHNGERVFGIAGLFSITEELIKSRKLFKED